jgi:hypothetical protein
MFQFPSFGKENQEMKNDESADGGFDGGGPVRLLAGWQGAG